MNQSSIKNMHKKNSTKSIEDLIQLLKVDNMVAFYQIYQRYSKRIYSFVLGFLKNETDAEEIVQEVFIRIWESRHQIDNNASFDSFIFTIAYNNTINLFRKRTREKKHIEYLKSIQHIDIAPDLINEIYFNDLNDKVQFLLKKLPPRQEEVFRLSREKGMSHQEISEKLDIKVNTVKKHISKTLSFLRSHLDTLLVISYLSFYIFLL